MVQEQLLDSLPVEVKIWVREHKPKTSTEAAELADNYLRARRQEKNTRGGEDPSKERKPWHRQREGNDENGVKGKAQSQDGAKEKGLHATQTRRGVDKSLARRKGPSGVSTATIAGKEATSHGLVLGSFSVVWGGRPG